MLPYLPGLALLLLSFSTPNPSPTGPAPVDKLGVPGPLKFGKTTFYLASSGPTSSTAYSQEYLPKGETFANYQQMLTVAVLINTADIETLVNLKINELEARKQTDILCHYQVLSNAAKKEIMLDFLVSQNVNQPQRIVEFDLHRYQQVQLRDDLRGSLLYFYSKRSYGAATEDFMHKLSQTRTEDIATMAAAKMPAIKLVISK